MPHQLPSPDAPKRTRSIFWTWLRGMAYQPSNRRAPVDIVLPAKGGRVFGVTVVYGDPQPGLVRSDNAVVKRNYLTIFVSKTFPFLSFSPERLPFYKHYQIYSLRVPAGAAAQIALLSPDGTTYADQMIAVVQSSEARIGMSGQALSDNILADFVSDNRASIAALDWHAATLCLWQDKPSAAGKSTGWKKARAVLNATHRKNHRETRALVSAINAQSGEQQEQEFGARLDAFLDGYAVGPHGYRPKLQSVPLADIIAALSELIAGLDALGVACFINSGTLLGFHREGGVIPHDDDFDLAVVVPGDDIETVSRNWLAFCAKVANRAGFRNKGNFCALTILNRFEVDLFPAWINDGKAFVYPYLHGEISADSIMPLQAIRIGNHAVPTPRDIESVLAVNYGNNWRTPDKFWKFDWADARKKFARERPFIKLSQDDGTDPSPNDA